MPVSLRLQTAHRNRGSRTVTSPNSVAIRCGRQSSRGISRCRNGNPDEAAHVDRLGSQRPPCERSSEAASPRVGSSPGPRSLQDLPAGRSPSGQRSARQHHRRPRPTAPPTASEFPQPVYDPTGRTDPIGIPPYPKSLDTPERRAEFDRRTAIAYDNAKAVNAVAGGGIDDVIDPAETRHWIANSLKRLPTKRLPPVPPRTEKKYPYIDPW
jgi:hypothetical protein